VSKLQINIVSKRLPTGMRGALEIKLFVHLDAQAAEKALRESRPKKATS
jgi:hypothetical protein